MKRYLLVLLLFIPIWVYSQTSPAYIKRVPNSSTTFVSPIQQGTLIYDIQRTKLYQALTGLSGTASLSSLTEWIDYVEVKNDFSQFHISAFELLPDARYVTANLPNVNAANGDTLEISQVISGNRVFSVYGVSDGARGISYYGIKAKGKLEADSILVSSLRATGQVQGDSINAVTKYLLNGVDINKTGTLDSIAYRNRDNNFLKDQTISGRLHATDVHATDSIESDYMIVNDSLIIKTFRMATGASNGYILKTDANGYGTWQMQTSSYKGVWNANTNTPTISDATGSNGDFYIVSTGGTQDLGSGNVTFQTGGTAIHNGSVWEAVNPSQIVTSVNSLIGDVQLDLSLSGDTLMLTGGTDSIDLSLFTSFVKAEDTISAHNTRLIAIENDTTHYQTAWDSVAIFHTRFDNHTDSLKTILNTRLPAIENDTTHYQTAWDSVAIFHRRLDWHTDSLLLEIDTTDAHAIRLNALEADSINWVHFADSLITFISPSQLTDSLNIVRDTTNDHYTRLNALEADSANWVHFHDSLTTFITPTQLTDSLNIVRDTTGDHSDRIVALEGKTLETEGIWEKDADSTVSALYPANLSALRTLPDSRYNIVNIPNVNALYGDTLGVNYVLSGEYLLRLFGIADGAQGISGRTLDFNGTIIADSIAGYAKLTDVEGLRDTTNLKIDSTKLRLTHIEDDTTHYQTAWDSVAVFDGRLNDLEADSANWLHWADTTDLIATKYDLDTLSFLRTETDPVWAADSSKVLHFADTTSTIATKDDITTDIIPKADITYDLGAPSYRWADIYGSKGTFVFVEADLHEFPQATEPAPSAGIGFLYMLSTDDELYFKRPDGSKLSLSNGFASTTLNNLGTISHATTDLDKFLALDTDTVKYRTGAELYSDIGLTDTLGLFARLTGATFSGKVSMADSLKILGGKSLLTYNASNALRYKIYSSGNDTYFENLYEYGYTYFNSYGGTTSMRLKYLGGVELYAGTGNVRLSTTSTGISINGYTTIYNASGYENAQLDFQERTGAPLSPPAGYGSLYGLNDKKLYYKNSDGTVYDLTASGGGGGSVTSVTAGNGMNFTTITTTGTVTLGTPSSVTGTSTNGFPSATTHTHELGTVPYNKGGTGLTSVAAGSVFVAQSANTISALSSTSGDYYLKNVDGTMSWAAGTGTTPPGGSSTQLQYNNAGSFGGTSGLTWDGTNMIFDDNKVAAFGTAGASDSKIFWNATTLNIASSNYHYFTDIGGTNLFNTNATGVNIPSGKTYQINGTPIETVLAIKKTITADSIRILYSRPIQIIPAPGAGYAVQIVCATASWDASGTAFSEAISLYLNTKGCTYPQFDLEMLWIDDPAHDQMTSFSPLAFTYTDSNTILENTQILLRSETDVTGGSTGVINIYVSYRIITL
jgi:hypothetical protein